MTAHLTKQQPNWKICLGHYAYRIVIDLCNYVYGYITNQSYQEDENIWLVDVVMRYGQHSWNLYENIKLHNMHTIIIVFRQPNK